MMTIALTTLIYGVLSECWDSYGESSWTMSPVTDHESVLAMGVLRVFLGEFQNKRLDVKKPL